MIRTVAIWVVLALATAGRGAGAPVHAAIWRASSGCPIPGCRPDGRFVALHLRSTDWEANRGVKRPLGDGSRAAAASRRGLIRDEEKSATAPRWSADGRWLYFLSWRSGSTPASGGRPPLAAGRGSHNLAGGHRFYRLAPDGAVRGGGGRCLGRLRHPGVQQGARRGQGQRRRPLAWSYQGATPASGTPTSTVRYLNLFAVRLDGQTPAADGVALTRGYQTVHRRAARRRRFGLRHRPGRQGGGLRRPSLRRRPGNGRSRQPLYRAARRQLAGASPRLRRYRVGQPPGLLSRWIAAGLALGPGLGVHRAARAHHWPGT